MGEDDVGPVVMYISDWTGYSLKFMAKGSGREKAGSGRARKLHRIGEVGCAG